jgi:membrane fusion protein (multidrug efflux system)
METKSESAPTESPVRPIESARPAPQKKRRPFLVLGVIAVITAGGIGAWMMMTAGQENTDDAAVAADVVPVGARVSGQVKRVAVVENQQVKRGDLLVELDDADYAARVMQAEAGVDTAKAQAAAADADVRVVTATSKGGLSTARAQVSGSSVGVSSAEAQVAAARAGLLRAETEVKRADIDLSRAKELRAANAVPQERLDNAQLAADSTRAQLAQAKAQLAAAEEARRAADSRVSEARGHLEQSEPIDARIAAARANADLAHARVKAAEAALELAKLDLSYTKVVAPSDGMASKLAVHQGQLLQAGQPVIELVPAQTYVIANFKETQVGAMRPGQRADVEIDAFPGRHFAGVVESLSGGTGSTFSLLPPDNASGNFVKVVQRVPVRIKWAAPADASMRAGLSAEVTVHTRSSANAD